MPAKYNYDWEKLHDEQQQSGMNMRKFCREYNIPYQSFKNHKYQNKKQEDMISIVPVTCAEQNTISFVINGVHLSINSSLDDEGLRRIVKAIQ